MNIAVLDSSTVLGDGVTLDSLSAYGKVSLYNRLSEKEIIESCKKCEVIVCNKSKITENIIKNCPNLRFITLLATGYNNIDIAAAGRHGVVVSNSPNYSTDSVAQLVFAMILQFANSLCKYDTSVKHGDWASCKDFCYFPFPLFELRSKTLGIIGFGAIGRRVAEIGKAFGMNVIASSRSKKQCDGVEFTEKKEVFRRADFLTLHCPLNSDTENLVNKETLALMKPTAYLINTSRGAVVNELDLLEALKLGTISGAGIDVLETEPMKKDCPYLDAPNIIITPHIAWATVEARSRLIETVAENIKCFIAGNPQNVVNG